jgi:hypothetical protein
MRTFCGRYPMAVAALTLVVTGCSWQAETPRKQTVRLNSADSLSTALIDDVIPTVDGGAYARTMAGGIWYLVGAAALRVKAVGDSSTRHRFESAALYDVQPTADGGAYAYTPNGSLWRLKADSAFMVVERSSSTALTPAFADNARLAWALYTRERRKRLAVEEDVQSAQDAADDAWDASHEPPDYP